MPNRVDYYKRADVEAVINVLNQKGGHIDPVFDLDIGYRYADVEKAIGINPDDAVHLLEELYEGGLLDSRVYDMEIRCPDCGSPNVSTRYLCPSCGSFHIKKTFLREHLDCGYLGPVVSYGEPMICPKCQQPMVEGTYKNAGSIYECADCRKQIDTPFVNHWCRTKDFSFSFENAIYRGKFSYFPTNETSEDMQRGILFVSPITSIFESMGMKRIENTKVIGTSGVELTFDLSYEGAGRKYYLDILQGKDPFGELDILKEYGKINDSKVDAYTLISPGIDQTAISMVQSYKMNVCDGSNPDAVLNKLTEMLKNRGNTITSKREEPKASENTDRDDKKPKSKWKSQQ